MSHELSVSEACELLGVTKQAWYEYHRQSFKDAVNEDLIVECVREIRVDMPGVGGRKLKELLKKEFHIEIGRDTLFELLDRHTLLIKPRIHHTRTTFSDHGLHIYPDLRKGFTPTDINQPWVSDITYIYMARRQVPFPVPHHGCLFKKNSRLGDCRQHAS